MFIGEIKLHSFIHSFVHSLTVCGVKVVA